MVFSANDPHVARFEYAFEGKTGAIDLQRFSFVDNAPSLNKDFDGMVYGINTSSGIPANFKFSLGSGQFKLTREITTGSCVFEGTYVPQSEAVSARGNYRCNIGHRPKQQLTWVCLRLVEHRDLRRHRYAFPSVAVRRNAFAASCYRMDTSTP